MQATRFTRQKPFHGWSNYVVIGIEAEKIPEKTLGSYVGERISRFNAINLLPNRYSLSPASDMVECDSDCIFHYLELIGYFNKSTLLVCNSSILLVGGSDFVTALESGKLAIARRYTSQSDYQWRGEDRQANEQFILAAPPTIIALELTNPKRRLTIVDILNYGMPDFEEIDKNVDKHTKGLLDAMRSPGAPHTDSAIECAIMARYMQEYYRVCKAHELGSVAVSYASQGMRRFRQKDYKEDIITHEHAEAAALERGCYSGGRCEAFYHGRYDGEVYLVDVQSLYPFLYCTKTFPICLEDYQESPSLSTVKGWCQEGIAFALVRIKTDEPAYPCNTKGRSIYPTGEFNCFLCCDELATALGNGNCTHVYRAARYESGYVLREYGQHMLKCRSVCKVKGNWLASHIVKCVTNGIHGKFGQLGNQWIITDEPIPHCRYGGYIHIDDRTGEETPYRVINWVQSKLVPTTFSDNSFVPIAAAANSYSRSYLWEMIKTAGFSNVLYAGIDSLIVTRNGLNRLRKLVASNAFEYGKLSVKETGNTCYIKRYGVYRIGSKIAYIGMPRSDKHSYRGFWNRRDWIGSSNDLPEYKVLYSGREQKPSEARAALGTECKSGGAFTSPIDVYDERLTSRILSSKSFQGRFRFPEWT